MGLKHDDSLTADEIELMQGQAQASKAPEADLSDEIAAAQADDGADTAAETADAAQAAADGADESAGESSAESDGESAGESNGESEGFVPKFQADAPANYEDQKKALRTEKAELRQKWSSGELSDEEWSAQESALEDKYEALRDQYLTAQALQKANEQIQAQQQQDTLRRLAADAKKLGIDYSDRATASVFDIRLNEVAQDPAFQGKSFDVLAAEANRRTLEMFGKVPGANTVPPKAQGTPPPQRAKIPPTLANMPAAASQPVSDETDAILNTDDPDLAEARWASLPTQKRSAMLRSTLPGR